VQVRKLLNAEFDTFKSQFDDEINTFRYQFMPSCHHAIMPHETLLKIHAILVQTCDIAVH